MPKEPAEEPTDSAESSDTVVPAAQPSAFSPNPRAEAPPVEPHTRMIVDLSESDDEGGG